MTLKGSLDPVTSPSSYAPNAHFDESVSSATTNGKPPGLTSTEAQARRKQFGKNAVVEEKPHPLRQLVNRFWAPIPWLLEVTIIIQLFLGEKVEALVIGGLLIVNATLSFVQEGRAQKALTLLRQQLRVMTRVRRDGAWLNLPA
jgi:H+-transporting ATPase